MTLSSVASTHWADLYVGMMTLTFTAISKDWL